MKIYLIAALFLAALVVAHAEDAETIELPEQAEQLDQPDQPEEEINDPVEDNTEDVDPPGTEGDTEESEDEEIEADEDEDEDEEDPEKRRRRRNVLSLFSCRQLKRRRYCRHAFIKRLCALTCFVRPPCRNRLSRLSCNRLRRLRKCNTFVGRTYCRKTCRRCPAVRNPCRNYAVLNQLNRKQSRNRGNVLLCDQKNFAKRWYRFTGYAGTKMPTRAPPKNRCGTHAPGWMVGRYPRRRNQVVRRKVCYHWGNSRCKWHNFIRVKNCGGYFVFYLSPTPVCHLRYCGNA